MKQALIALGLLFTLCSLPTYAENSLSLPVTEVIVRAHDGTELPLYQYPAEGNNLILWIGSNGWHDRAIQLAMDFAKQGIEVWQIDFAEALLQNANSNFMRNLDARYVADIIDAVHQRTGKRVILLAQSYASIPLLSGATLWQQRDKHEGKLLGAMLFSPNLVTALPALGKDPEYLPITRATHLPVMIYQGSLHGSATQFTSLLKEISLSNSQVFTTMLPGVTSLFYSEENSPSTLKFLQEMPAKTLALFSLFDSLPVQLSKSTYVQPQQVSDVHPDIKLSPFTANPLPPVIDLNDANGKKFMLQDYRGKVTVVNFWASWCSPCIEEIPSLNRLREQMQGQPFELISINYADSPAKIREFLKQVRVEFPVLVDPNGKVAQQWNVIGFPSTFVIGKDGRIKYGVNAAIHWDTPEIISTLKDLNR